MFTILRGGSLVAATVCVGLMAGLFYSFAIAVMLGLRAADDRTFVGAMQRMNDAILNGWFAIGFGGALVFTGLAAALHLRSDVRSALPWIVAGLVLYVLVLAITFGINVPLNDQLLAAGEPDRIADLAAVREQFEDKWVRWNTIRTVASTAALGCLAVALWVD